MSTSAVRYDTAWRLEELPATHRNRILLDWVGTKASILEMGCSTGFLSQHFRDRGCRVTGFEADREAAYLASKRCDRIICGDLNAQDWAESVPDRYDVIVFGDVLEHLLDPVSVLRACHRLLADSGKIIVSLPNVAHWSIRLALLQGRWNYTDIGILDRTHLKFFTLQTAEQMFHDAGFKVAKFHPVIGGRGAGKLPRVWTILTNSWPNLMGYQLMFELRSAN
jgi:2-polyprenyl-3-methyl-5-hydroxy-6-metoxy-1,4-benzoquinol methylase